RRLSSQKLRDKRLGIMIQNCSPVAWMKNHAARNSPREMAQSKAWRQSVSAICLALTLAAQQPALHGQLATPANHVLELAGTNSYVELPADAFANLTEVTVEGWVKWEAFGPMSRFFDFTLAGRELNVMNRLAAPTLFSELFRGDDRAALEVPGILPLGVWVHVAVTAGNDQMRLFLNGILIADNA